jgi:hypothetical protein
MDEKFLGDSYDLVKRFWAENLSSIAPIYADERLIPIKIRDEFTRVTRIPIFNPSVARPFAIFLDPCTGIPSPNHTASKPTKKHAPLQCIVNIFKTLHPKFVICFDQSFSRGGKTRTRIEEKMDVLTANGLYAFYYTSHANFLFVAESAAVTSVLRQRLLDKGIPNSRLIFIE